MKNKMQIGRVVRATMLGAMVLGVMPSAVGCLDRPVAPSTPRTSNTLTDQVRVSAVDKIDLLFMVDNSASMADKQKVLAKAVPDLVDRLINPVCVKPLAGGAVEPHPEQTPTDPAAACPAGMIREFAAIKDIHIGVVTSSMGSHGSDYCVDVDPASPSQDNRKNFTQNDRGRLLSRGPRKAGSTGYTVNDFETVNTYKGADGQFTGFFAWDPEQKATPPGEALPGDATEGKESGLKGNFAKVIRGTDQVGCGYEASLEAWYRFLVDPNPPASVGPGDTPTATAVVKDTDEVLLKQRADFLRPDSLVAIVNLSDENDCSIIDGALPATVCDDPVLDDNGTPTGECNSDRIGWPVGYVEGNFQDWKAANGRVTGTPFPANHLVALQKLNGASFHLSSGTEICATDPYSPACRSCYLGGDGCTQLDDTTDSPNLRCWNQKRRFGVDFLYPLKRYSDGLSQAKVYDRDGNLVTNPLFDDLPYKYAKKNGTAIKRSRAETRNALLIFYANIVGVPWQDIAKDPTDLTKGYKPALPTPQDPQGIDWDVILGNPFALEASARKGPTDPLMFETNVPRPGATVDGYSVPTTHPITKETVGGTGWNSVNGHEWTAGSSDLQYSCVFDLEQARPCTDDKGNAVPSCDCVKTDSTPATTQNPLCEKPDGSTAPKKPTKGDGTYSGTQYRAKAFPGTRFLQVARDFGGNSIVASICTPNLNESAAADYGYRPAVAAIIDRLKTQLSGRCLPRQLAANPDGSTPCLIIDAAFKKDPANPNNPDEVAACKACDRQARKKIDPAIASLLTGNVLEYECLCEVSQLAGADLNECQTEKDLALLTSGGDSGGWCYVDPGAVSGDKKDQAAAIVEKCPTNEKRTIRFVNAKTENTTLFITCLGAASGNEVQAPTSSDGTAGAGGGN